MDKWGRLPTRVYLYYYYSYFMHYDLMMCNYRVLIYEMRFYALNALYALLSHRFCMV